MLDFSSIKAITIPEGNVKKITDVITGYVLWQKISRILKEWRGLSPLNCDGSKQGNFEEVRVYGNSIQTNLPDGYTQLEYIESTGTQGILTDFVPMVDDTVIADVENRDTTGISGDKMFFGQSNTDSSVGGFWVEMYGTSNIWYVRYASTGSKNTSPTTQDKTSRITITLTKNSFSTSGGANIDLSSVVATTMQTTPLELFCRRSVTAQVLNGSKIRIFSYKQIRNNYVVLHLIPCRRNSDNKLGLYDVISNKFYYNNLGTGEFIAGGLTVPTPSTPIPIESVGDKTKNLFNKNIIRTGYRLSTTTGIGSLYGQVGDFITDGAYCVSDLIEIEAGKAYAKNTSADAYHRIHFYDKDKICIAVSNSSFVTSPNNAKYMAICMATSEIDTVQLEQGNASTSYEPYGYKVPIEIKGKNLADINSVIVGEYVNARRSDVDFGSIKYNSAWARTDYIEIEPNTTYTIYFDNIVSASSAGLCIYDKNKNVLDGRSTNSLKTNDHNITTPENSKYLIMSISTAGSITSELAIYKQDGTYENIPYTPPVTQTLYLNEPLRKIGEYADTINIAKSKNLFDAKTDIVTRYYIRATDGVVISNVNNFYCETYFEIEPDTSYVFFGVAKDTGILSNYNRIHWYDSTKTFISSTPYPVGEKGIGVSPSNAKYARISCNPINGAVDNTVVASFNWYFGKGDVNTQYVPYNPVQVIRNISKVTYTEANDWRVQNTSLAGSLAPYIYGQNPADMNTELPIYPNLLRCDVLTNALAGSSGGATMNGISPNTARDNMLMNVELDKFPTLDDWKEYVRLNPLVVYYVLNAPTTEIIGVEEPMQALEGTTIITVDTQIQPSELYASEWIEG